MNIIEALNIGLRAIGQSAVSSLDETDPDVSEWLNHYNIAYREILQNGYPFNTNTLNLVRSTTDGITAIQLNGYLKIKGMEARGLTGKNSRVWDPSIANYYQSDWPGAEVVTEISFGEIPQEFQEWIAYRAALYFFLQVKGPTADVAYWQQAEQNKCIRAENLYPQDYGTANGANRLLSEFNR